MNFLEGLDNNGHNEYGDRIYWQDRGYLPLIYINVKDLYDKMVNDNKLIKAFRFLDYAYKLLSTEYDYFMLNHSVDV